MPKPFKITFCGDTSLGYYYLEKGKNKYPEAYERLQSDPFSFFEGVAPLLEGSDEVIVNLETVLTNSPGDPIEGKEYPGFDDPEVTIDVLKRLGVTAVTLANNHTMDFGEQKLVEMIELLHENGIATIGAGRDIKEAREPYIIKLPKSGRRIYIINGMRARRRYIEYGFFAEKNKPGIANTRLATISRQIEKIKASDPEGMVIVCPHWQGIDYKNVDEVKKEWCKEVVLAGADVVVGHGTHKKDEYECHADGRIYYSIGNFVFNSPGRYAAKGVDPFSMVVSVFPEEERFEEKLINTDNKDSGFYSSLVSESSQDEHSLQNPTSSRSIFNARGYEKKMTEAMSVFLKCNLVNHISVKDATIFSGVDHRLKRVSEDLFYLVMDETWPQSVRKKYKVLDLTPEEIIKRAKKRGVAKFIVGQEAFNESLLSGCEYVVVKSTYAFYFEVAGVCRGLSKTKVIAITGSAGKSTTKSMIVHMLEDEKDKVYVPGIAENITTCITSHLTKLEGFDYAVIEASGQSLKKFEKARISISPDVAVVTSISEAHLDYLGSLSGVAEIKAKIFSGMPIHGSTIINSDTQFYDLLQDKALENGAKVVGYGERSSSSVRLLDYDFESGKVKAEFFGEELSYALGARGKHMANNSLAAIIAVKEAGFSDWKEKAYKLESFSPLSGRGEVFNIKKGSGEFVLIDESYNANPASMRSALQILSNSSPRARGKKVAVLGEMLELGEGAREIHEELLGSVLESGAEKVVLVGEAMEGLWLKIPGEIKGALFPSISGLYAFLKSEIGDGDIVMFKSSNSVGLNKVVERFKRASRKS